MKKFLNILKWTGISILVVAASIRMAYVDSERKKHIEQCEHSYMTKTNAGLVIINVKTCTHYE